MSNEIESVHGIPVGDTKELPFTVTNEDGAVDLTDAEITYELRENRRSEPVISLDDDGVEICERDNSAGTFTVRLDAYATDDLTATGYRERIVIVDAEGNRTTWIGRLHMVADR